MIIMLIAAGVLMLGGILFFIAQSFVIEFDTRGGENLASMKTTRLGSAKLPVPVQPGQTFLGWTESPQTLPNGKNTYTSTKQINSGKKLYAHWEETNFVINFYSENEQVNQLGYSKETSFIDAMMIVAPYRDYFMPVPYGEPRWTTANFREDPESGQSSFAGWSFRDAQGRPSYLWFLSSGAPIILETELSADVRPNIWTLEYFDESLGENGAYQLMELIADKPFLPQMYDSSMHAVWRYRGVIIESMTREGNFPSAGSSPGWTSGPDIVFGRTIEVGENGSLDRLWYQGTESLIGWKIGFKADSGNRSPLKIGEVGDSDDIVMINKVAPSTGVHSRLSPLQLQRINDLFDKVHPIYEPFYIDPLLAYLAYQGLDVLGRTYTLYIYPVTAKVEDGVSESRFFDARFNPITESGMNIKRVQVSPTISRDGTGISLGMPRTRNLENFTGYYYEIYKTDPNTGIILLDSYNRPFSEGHAKVTAEEIQYENSRRRHGVTVSTNNMHPTHATVFYETWEKKTITVNFDYGPDAKKKNGVYSNGKRLIHSLTYGNETNDKAIKSRYHNADPITKELTSVGETIVLPSASMYTRQNMNFIGWQEGLQKDGKLGRVYPAGHVYTVVPDYGFSYTLHAVWVDSTVNFAFNLEGGRGFNPDNLGKLMRGRVDSIVKIPDEKPTRFGYQFIGWVSSRADDNNNNKTEYKPGDTIRIMRQKQILTAKWEAKNVSMTLHYAFEDDEDNPISGVISLEGKFDQTIRLQGITQYSTSVAVTRSFDSLYRLIGWTFRDPSNVDDPRGITLAATQTVNLNERIVREVAGEMYADGFIEDEKNTVSLVVYDEFRRDVLTATTPLINSRPRLLKSDYQLYINQAGLNLTHDFLGFFALPQEIVEMPSFNIDYYWDRDNGMYKTGSFENVPGQFLRFYSEMTDGVQVEVAGKDGTGVAQNYRITEPMYFYLWLKPKPVYIDFYGVQSTESGGWEHTAEADYSDIQSYFGDKRQEVMNLGNPNNLSKIPAVENFFFLEWSVEYYAEGATQPFETHIIDLRRNASGVPQASAVTLELSTSLVMVNNLTQARTPVHRIKVKPHMQSVYDFVVRVIDDGSITGTRGTAFNITMQKDDLIIPIPGTEYIGGTVTLAADKILKSEIRWFDPQWGMERWPQEIYNYDNGYGLYYWEGSVYVGPGSESNPYASLEDLLDHNSRTITRFYSAVTNLQGTGAWDGAGASYAFGQKVSLHPNPSTGGFFDVRTGTVILYPTYAEISYAIELVNGNHTSPIVTHTTTTSGGPIYANGGIVQLGNIGGINNTTQRQPGFYFDERDGVNNLSTINYMASENSHIPGKQRQAMFQIGKTYSVGHLDGQIPTRSIVRDGDGRKVIRLYIVWLPSAVVLRYENTAETVQSASNIHLDTGYEVGDTLNMVGRINTWFKPGYIHAGWSVNQNGSEPRFAFTGDGNGMQQVLISATDQTNSAARVLNATTESPNTSSYPHTLTIKLYPWWAATIAESITFDFSPLPEDTNAVVILDSNNRFRRQPGEHDNWTNNWIHTLGTYTARTIGSFPFDRNLGNVEADWKMFEYNTPTKRDARQFGGWYYVDPSNGEEHNLEIVNGQLMLNEIFLARGTLTPNNIRQHIEIKARWVDDTQSLIHFNIANEAVEMKYEIVEIPDADDYVIGGPGTIVNVNVSNGSSGDVEFLEHPNADNIIVPYKLKYNEYIGPRGSAGAIKYPNIVTHPQFFRTEVAVNVIGNDGGSRTVVRTLNSKYERLISDTTGDNSRTVISKAAPLVRYETRRIPISSASQLNAQSPFVARMTARSAQYNTFEIGNYATFEGRDGDPITTGSTGVQINSIYRTFVMGEVNDRYQGDDFHFGVGNRFEALDARPGYELVGFAISDEFNKGVAFGWDGYSGVYSGAPNTYVNNYLFSPRPEPIVMVPIYKPLNARLTLRKQFPNTELARYTQVVYDPLCEIDTEGHVCTSTCGKNPYTDSNDEIIISTRFDERLDLPYLDTRGPNKNPLLDSSEWLQSWQYGTNPEVHAVFGDRPAELMGYDLDNALGFHVKHDPRPAPGNLMFDAVWGNATRMEVYFHVLVPERNKPMDQWKSERLYFDPAAVNQIAGNPNAYADYQNAFLDLDRFANSNLLGSVAEHYRKPVLENGVYNYSRATYTVPVNSTRLPDSAFNMNARFANWGIPGGQGLHTLGWFMEDPTAPVVNGSRRPHIGIDPVTGQLGMPKTLNPLTGKYEYQYQYVDGNVDRFLQRDQQTNQWNETYLSPTEGGATQSINIYLVYDWNQGSITYHGVFPDVTENFPLGRSIFARYGDIIALPTSQHIARYGKEFVGWTEGYALQRMQSYVITEAEAKNLDNTRWQINDFVKVANGPGGSPGFMRKTGANGEQSTLEWVTILNGNYHFTEGRIDMFAVWEERIIVHTFMDGDATRIWGLNLGGIEDINHHPSYGLEVQSEEKSSAFQNGIAHQTKFFQDNAYGGLVNSSLPRPTKEGYKFLHWRDSYGQIYTDGTLAPVLPGTSVTHLTLYAVWAPYYYQVEFIENNPDGPTSSRWTSVNNDIQNANPGALVVGGRVVTAFDSILPFRIPAHEKRHFVWTQDIPDVGLLGWSLQRDNGEFFIDTRNRVQTLGFGVNDRQVGDSHTVKVGNLNRERGNNQWIEINQNTLLDYAGQAEEVASGIWVRKVNLYAFWSAGLFEVSYFDNYSEFHTQDAYMLSPDRTRVAAEHRLVVPSLDNDYMRYGIMVADESIISPTRRASMFAAGKSFGGWQIKSAVGEHNPVGRIYYPGEFLDGIIRDNIQLEAVWLDWHNDWGAIAGGTSQTDILVIPGSLGATYFSENVLRVTNPNIKTIIFPRMTNGAIGENCIIAHDVTRIVLPSVEALTIAPQAIKAKSLKTLYISDNLVVNGNPVGGEAIINQSTGAIEITSAMTAYLVRQGAFRIVYGEGGVIQDTVIAVTDGNYSNDPEDENYLRGGDLNQRSAYYSYVTNATFFGALYSLNRSTLFAYPGAATQVQIDNNVRNFAAYAFAYMARLTSTSELPLVAANSATTVAARAVFHSTAGILRLPTTTTGTGVNVNAISGYQPNLGNIYFGVSGTTESATNIGYFDTGVLYRASNMQHVMYVTSTAGSVANIPNSVTTINDYALSSFYRAGNVADLTINARVALRLAHFQDSDEGRGQHTFHLTRLTLGGSVTSVSSVDHRIFSRMGNQFVCLNIESAGIALHNTEPDAKTFPIFVANDAMMNTYLALNWAGTWGKLTNVDGVRTNPRMQTEFKEVVFNAGSITLPVLGLQYGTGTQTIIPQTPMFNGTNLVIPQNTFTAPADTVFVGWRISSENSAINGMIYQPGWVFSIGMTNSQVALNQRAPDYIGQVNGIYIQSMITLTAIWEISKLQSIDKDGVNLTNQKVLVETSPGVYRNATNLELAGKRVTTDGRIVNAVSTNGLGMLSFTLAGANLATFNSHNNVDLGATYGFVGWIKRSNAFRHPDWNWGLDSNIAGRIIPDGVSSGAFGITLDVPLCIGELCPGCTHAASIVYYHALYDITSTTAGTVKYTVSELTNASASIADRTGNGDIGIPVAVIDSSVSGVANPYGFMRRVTIIEENGFANMTGTRERVYIGGSVQQIKSHAFMSNGSTISEVIFGHNYVDNNTPGLSIGNYAFAGLDKVTSIKLPLATTSIGASAFIDNLSLTSVAWETNRGGGLANARLTSIGEYAFWGNMSMTDVFQIPAGVTGNDQNTIGYRAFAGTKITAFTSAITLPNAGARYYTIDGNLCRWGASNDVTLLVYAPGKLVTNVAIGTGVLTGIHHISSSAFANNMTVASLSLPTAVRSIAVGAFEYSLIKTITLAHETPSGIQEGVTGNPFRGTVFALTVQVPNATGTGQLQSWRTTYAPVNFIN